MKSKLSSTIALVSLTCLGSAQFDQLWMQSYNGTAGGTDASTCVVIDKMGNTYIAGRSARIGTGIDYVIIKYDSLGVKDWEVPIFGASNGDDIPHAIAVSNDGNFVYVTGESRNAGIGQPGNFQFRTVKLDAKNNGNILFNKTLDHNGQNTRAYDLAINEAGHVFVTGTTEGTTTDILTMRYDENGDAVSGWPELYNDPGNNSDRGVAISVGPMDNVFVAGVASREANNEDWITIRYSGAGVLQWKRYCHGDPDLLKDDAPTDIVTDSQNNVFVCGAVLNSGTHADMGVVSYNIDGEDRWNVPGVDQALEFTTTSESIDEIANALDIQINNMGVAVNVFVTGTVGPAQFRDYMTLCYSAAANTSVETWSQPYDGNLDDFA